MVFDALQDTRGSGVVAEVVGGVCRQSEVAIHQRHEGQRFPEALELHFLPLENQKPPDVQVRKSGLQRSRRRRRRLGASLTKHASSLRVIVTIRLSCGTCSPQILLMLMSVISLKSQKVCHCQNTQNTFFFFKWILSSQNVSVDAAKLIWISPQLLRSFHWFESQILQ